MLSKFKERQYKEDWLCKAVKKVNLKSRDMLVNSKKIPKTTPDLHIPQRQLTLKIFYWSIGMFWKMTQNLMGHLIKNH